jgi:hypothetical protein
LSYQARGVCDLVTYVSRNAPRETVRKGVIVTSEASILVVSSNKIELLGLFSSGFEASGRSYQDFSDSLRRVLLGNPHSPGPIAPGPARPASRQLSHNTLQTPLAPVPCWGHWTGQQPLRLLKHTKQFSQTGVQRLPALPLYTDLRGPIRV